MTTTHNHPQYDLITNSPPAAGSGSSRQDSLRASQAPKPDTANEEWRAQIHKLQYEVNSLKQEQDAVALRHQEELRKVQNRAEADYKRAQASESSSHAASGRYEATVKELRETHEQFMSEKRELDKRVRVEQEQSSRLREELEDLALTHSARERQFQHEIQELDARIKTSQQTAEGLRIDRDEKDMTLRNVQSRLSQREVEIGNFENELLRLKTQTGDLDISTVLKRELAEQVEHIKEIESANVDLRIELKQLRKQQKTINIVEEEKRSLEAKVKMMSDLRKELGEAQLQKQILEDERRSWTAYLERAESDDQDMQFDTPEDLAKAFVKERFEKASLVDQLGKVSPELTSKDEAIRSLEEQMSKLRESFAKMNPSSDETDFNLRTRLERQQALAMKEIEYLRVQLKTFETEEGEFQSETIDKKKMERIAELESLVDQYRTEVQTLHDDLDKSSNVISFSESTTKSSKRPRSGDDSSERLGELLRKTRTLQDTLSRAETAKTIVEKELKACKSQLKSLKDNTRTRVLELRDNPTAKAESIKQSTLNDLRSENAALISQVKPSELSTSSDETQTQTLPVATLNRLRGEIAAQADAVAVKEKHILRLKQIYSSKSKEFREAVASILGWKFDFMPNGRVRVTSLFYPGVSEDEGGEGSNSIVFDGENETMKVSGGPQSAFAGEIRPLVEFWVEGRNEIPCFLAACTLEFWEKSTRAQKI